jgi:hypothetical protein
MLTEELLENGFFGWRVERTFTSADEVGPPTFSGSSLQI